MAQTQPQVHDKDKALPFLTKEEATYIRDLFKEACAKQGREVTMFPDHAEGSDGAILGFWNVAADCHKYPRHLWPRIIADHLRIGLIDPNEDFFKGMSRKEVLRHTYIRLYAEQGMPDPSWYPYAREVAPGIRELVVLHRRKMTFLYRQQDVDRFGGLEVLRETGLANLRILPVEHRELIETPEGGHFKVLSGHSSCTASRVLVLDRLVGLLYPDNDAPHGVLAAVPNRHEVAVHIIQDDSALPTLIGLTTFAWKHAVSAPGAISPNVYWVNEDHFQEVSVCGGEGVEFRFSPEFQTLMGSVLPPDTPGGGKGLRAL